MKPLKTLLLLILISWALLLNTVGESAENPLGEKSVSKAEQKRQADTGKNERQNKAEPANEFVSKKTPEPKETPKSQEPKKYWYDFLFETAMPNWVVIVGWGLAFIVAWRTLGTLRRQTVAVELSASAARDSAKAAMTSANATNTLANLERPWVMIYPDRKPNNWPPHMNRKRGLPTSHRYTMGRD